MLIFFFFVEYDIIEQIGEAAAEVGNKDMSIVCYKLLKNQFPGSQRVKLFLDRLHVYIINLYILI